MGAGRFGRASTSPTRGSGRSTRWSARCRLLADIGDGVPSFYVDDHGVYWMHSESEQYESTLEVIERSAIESRYPTVDPDHPLSA